MKRVVRFFCPPGAVEYLVHKALKESHLHPLEVQSACPAKRLPPGPGWVWRAYVRNEVQRAAPLMSAHSVLCLMEKAVRTLLAEDKIEVRYSVCDDGDSLIHWLKYKSGEPTPPPPRRQGVCFECVMKTKANHCPCCGEPL